VVAKGATDTVTFSDQEPAVTAGTLTALVAALLALVAAFGLPVTPQQRDAILGLVAVVAPIAVALLVRPQVTPNKKADVRVMEALSSSVVTPAVAPH
jgi:hypothetical protein